MVYGSKRSDDIQSYWPNDAGLVDLREMARDSSDANFKVKPGSEGFLSTKNAAAFFNAAEALKESYPGESKLVVTDAGREDGADYKPHTTHGQGRSVDMRYPDGNGNPLQGPSAAAAGGRAFESPRPDH